jgi:hypothetical protein
MSATSQIPDLNIQLVKFQPGTGGQLPSSTNISLSLLCRSIFDPFNKLPDFMLSIARVNRFPRSRLMAETVTLAVFYRGPDRTLYKTATAVRANIFEQPFYTIHTEGAFVAADTS